ncbi:MAG TPA: ProQ/FinO family protein [Xanthobacteraceae bacterium]|jgi:sRNA-binding protein
MSKTGTRARIGAIIKLLSDQFPHTFNRRDPRPLKVGIHADVLTALGDAVQHRDLKSALRAYTSNARYLGALSAGASRIDLDAKLAGTVTAEDEALAKRRLAESARRVSPPANVAPPAKLPPAAQTGVKPSAPPPAEQKLPAPSAPKRLSLTDLREAGRRRRGGMEL